MASPPGAPAAADGPNLNNNNNSRQGVRKCGYLRKLRHGHKRFFVLRAPAGGGDADGGGGGGAPRLEYYESEKKWRSKAAAPKRVIALDCCLNVHKRADAKHKYLVALYTRDEYFAVAADSEQEQDGWYRALAQLLGETRAQAEPPPGAPRHAHPGAAGSAPLPGALGPDDAPAYREVWQVTLKPKGLGQSRHLTGVHRLCLSARTVGFVRLNCEQPAVTLQLMSIRRCGHSDSFFFMEVGRSAATGPGELWMQADDAVVAQNIHETILEAMKALKELCEFRPRSKSQSSATHPISVPGARRHHHPVHLPPSQTGLPRRSRNDGLAATPPAHPAGAPRARTASEGDGAAGSPVSPGPGRAALGRSHTPGAGRGFAPPPPPPHVAPSPPPHPGAPRPSSGSASASGSPSDAGCMSQDEYGSSPGAPPGSRTPESGSGTPPATAELAGYVSMDRPAPGRGAGDWERALHRPRTCSLSAPARQRPVPPQPASASLDERTLLRAALARSPGHPRAPASSPRLAYPEDYGHVEIGPGRAPHDGYVPMTPGAALLAGAGGGDYVPMSPMSPTSPTSPTSVSAPKLILQPRGLAGAPQAADSSPDDGRYVRMWCGARLWVDGARSGGDYLNMSPGDAGTPPDSAEPPRGPPGFGHGHGHGPGSLPRAAKAAALCNGDTDQYVLMSSPVGRILEEEDGPEPGPRAGQAGQVPGRPLRADGLGPVRPRPVRPTRLALDAPPRPPCASEPRSPGEYIHIDFGEPASAASSSPLLAGSPASSLGSGTPGTSGDSRLRSPLSDYMNLDPSLSSPRSPQPGRPGDHPLGSPDALLSPDAASPCPPLPPRPPTQCARDEPGDGDGDYTEMALGVAAAPSRPELSGPVPAAKRRSLKEQVSGVEAFLQAGPPDPHRGAKVIRADPQGGRRRHSSETFSSTTTVTPVSPSFAHTPKRPNSASVENVSLRKSSEGGVAPGAGDEPPASPRHLQPGRPWTAGQLGGLGAAPMRRETSSGFQNGLNYIAIDVREQVAPHPADRAAWGRTRSLGGLMGTMGAGGATGGCGGPGSGAGSYASIDFLAHHLKEAAVVKE